MRIPGSAQNVISLSTNNQSGTVFCRYGVVSSYLRTGRANSVQQRHTRVSMKFNFPVVAQEHAVPCFACDRVVSDSSDSKIQSVPEQERVISSLVRECRGDFPKHRHNDRISGRVRTDIDEVKLCQSVITQHDIL